MLAVAVYRHGGPEALTPTEWDAPEPGPGEVQVDVSAIGVNYHETYELSGLYPRQVPYVPGREFAGTVTALGEGVNEFAAGDIVASVDVPDPGAYAERVVLPAHRAIKVPQGISAHQACAALLQGMTVHMLTRDSHPVRSGETAVVHAAAGGVGLLLTQVLDRLGVRVIGTVSSREKESAARAAGARDVIRYTDADFVSEVQRLTGNAGADVVYDAVGDTTFDGSLACLRRQGKLVLYGQSSGKVPPVDVSTGPLRSKMLTRPYLPDFIATRDELLERADAVFGWMRDGRLKIRVDQTYPLEKAADAHRDLQDRRTIGKLLITP
ncbi:quinone oxidoreductase family protein [Amycolatopsis sp. VS8301801F10]|uniref:quinone oxidoreductase family protein n=1 Tax=Amycolatopsis sp. VS8301801F10 TaxID=2652442 RepID=UPI0038FCA697